MDISVADAKSAARVLRDQLAATGVELGHGQALEMVAGQLGYRDWNTASAALQASASPMIGEAVPVLRVHDAALAREFYVDYLGFAIEWEHRFEADLPIYMRLCRGHAVLDLSEHHGDGTPGTVVWVRVADVRSLHRELSARGHRRLRPGVDQRAPGGPTMVITDPFANVLRFCVPIDG